MTAPMAMPSLLSCRIYWRPALQWDQTILLQKVPGAWDEDLGVATALH